MPLSLSRRGKVVLILFISLLLVTMSFMDASQFIEVQGEHDYETEGVDKEAELQQFLDKENDNLITRSMLNGEEIFEKLFTDGDGETWVMDDGLDGDLTVEEIYTNLWMDPASDLDIDIEGMDGSHSGWNVVSLDLDDSGQDDVVIGAPYATDGGENEVGAVYIFYGDGLDGTEDLDDADVTIKGESAGDRFGWSVGNASHWSGGDGEDLVVGAPEWDGGSERGRAYVFKGDEIGTYDDQDASHAYQIYEGEEDGDEFGYAVGGGAELTGEDNIFIGAPGWRNERGRVYVYEDDGEGTYGQRVHSQDEFVGPIYVDEDEEGCIEDEERRDDSPTTDEEDGESELSSFEADGEAGQIKTEGIEPEEMKKELLESARSEEQRRELEKEIELAEESGGLEELYENVVKEEVKGSGEVFLDEDFSTWPPPDWERVDDAWEQSQTSEAGGEAPEAHLYWQDAGDFEAMDTPEMDTMGADELELEFKSYIEHDGLNEDFNAGIWVTDVEDPETGDWESITPWDMPVSSDEGPDTYTIDISDWISPYTMVGFEYSDQSGAATCAMNNWYINDVIVEDPTEEPVDPPEPPIQTYEDWAAMGGTFYDTSGGNFEFDIDETEHTVEDASGRFETQGTGDEGYAAVVLEDVDLSKYEELKFDWDAEGLWSTWRQARVYVGTDEVLNENEDPADWETVVYDLSDESGTEDISFRMHSPDGTGESGHNVWYDDIQLVEEEEPAEFELSGWRIEPEYASTDGEVTIEGYVENTGGVEGTVDINLKIDGDEVDSETEVIGPEQSEEIEFSGIPDDDWDISESGSFDVVVEAVPQGEVEPDDTWDEEDLQIADFELSDWSIDPESVGVGEDITIAGEIENTGTIEADVNVELHIGELGELRDMEVEEALSPGETRNIEFTHSKEETGTYEVHIQACGPDENPIWDDLYVGEFDVTWGLVETNEATEIGTDSATLHGTLGSMPPDAETTDLLFRYREEGDEEWIETDPTSIGTTIETIFEDDVSEDKGYDTWTSHLGASDWGIRDHGSSVGDQSWDWGDGEFNKNEDFGFESRLTSPEIEIPEDADDVILTFEHWRDFGDGSQYDAGNLRISVDGGDFELITPDGGYDGTVPTAWNNPLGGEQAWGGENVDWETATFDLMEEVGEEIAGSTIELRWNAGTEEWDGLEGEGWRIDDIKITAEVEDADFPYDFSEEIDGLESSTEYEFKAVAQWNENEDVGEVKTFETDPEEYTLTIENWDIDGITEVTVGGEAIPSEEDPYTEEFAERTGVDIVAILEEGYEFVEWDTEQEGLVDPTDESTTTVTMDQDVTIEPQVELKTYDVTVTFDDDEVAQLVIGDTTDVGSGQAVTFDHGDDVQITVTLEDGYEFNEWTGDTGALDNADVKDAHISDIDQDVSLEFHARLETLTVEFTELTGNGHVEAEYDGITETLENIGDSFTVDYGENVEFTPIPAEGYEFVEWTEDASEESEETFTTNIEDDYNIGVVFQEEPDDPQFILKDWSVDPEYVNPGEDVTIEGYLENVGGTTEDDIYARYFIDGSLVDAVPMGDDFAPGDEGFVSRYFDREDPGIYDVEIVAYCDDTGTDYDTWSGEFEVLEADLTITGKHEGDRFGHSLAGILSVSQDLEQNGGWTDLIVGAPHAPDDDNTGRAYIFVGGEESTHIDLSQENADVTLVGDYEDDLFGWSVFSAGDANGNGYGDVVVGAPGYGEDEGRVYIYLGDEDIDDLSPDVGPQGNLNEKEKDVDEVTGETKGIEREEENVSGEVHNFSVDVGEDSENLIEKRRDPSERSSIDENEEMSDQIMQYGDPPTDHRTPAQREKADEILVHWSWASEYGDGYYHRDLVEAIADDADTTVRIVVQYEYESEGSPSEEGVHNFIENHVDNMGNVVYEITGSGDFPNNHWIRDYGPVPIMTEDGGNTELEIINMRYAAGPETDADDFPQYYANEMGLTYHDMYDDGEEWFWFDGGHKFVEGSGIFYSTDDVYDLNEGWIGDGSAEAVEEMAEEWFNLVGTNHGFNTVDQLSETGHLDMQVNILDETTVLVSEFEDYTDHPADAQVLDDTADFFENQVTARSGESFDVYRLPMEVDTDIWGDIDTYYTHANSLVVNDAVLVPTFGQGTDTDALNKYEDATPDHYNIIGIDSYDVIQWGGAIHCTTREIPEANMGPSIDITGVYAVEGEDIEVTADIYLDSAENLEEKHVYFDMDEIGEYEKVEMVSINENTYRAEFGLQGEDLPDENDVFEYFIRAEDDYNAVVYDGDAWEPHDETVDAAVQHDLTIDIAEGSEGEVYVDGDWYSPDQLPETFTYDDGQQVDLNANPDEGWLFEEWYDEIGEATYSENADILVEMTEDKELTAHFEEEEYDLTIDIANGDGSEVWVDDSWYGSAALPDTFTYTHGEQADLDADPAEGWIFDEWYDNIENVSYSTEADILVEMTQDMVLTAHFEEIDDIIVEDWYDLDDIRNHLDGDHVLANDLDSETDGYDGIGNSWDPIGHDDSGDNPPPFEGTFSGQGYKINDLIIDPEHSWLNGLFGAIDGDAEITDLGVDVTTSSASSVIYTGGLVGIVYDGLIENCYVTGSIESGATGDNSYAGGLVGDFRSGEITESYSTASVNGEGDHVGGLIGFNQGEVTQSYATGEVTGDRSRIGGLIGTNEGIVSESYATGDVYTNHEFSNAGGLIGRTDGDVDNSYSTGDVIAEEVNRIGGFIGCVGDEESNPSVTNSYSTGKIEYDSLGSIGDVGGFVGTQEGTLNNCFWDTDTSQTETGVGSGDGSGVTGEPTSEMQDISTFDTAGWDITSVETSTDSEYIWNIVEDSWYPFLSWQDTVFVGVQVTGCDHVFPQDVEIEYEQYGETEYAFIGEGETTDTIPIWPDEGTTISWKDVTVNDERWSIDDDSEIAPDGEETFVKLYYHQYQIDVYVSGGYLLGGDYTTYLQWESFGESEDEEIYEGGPVEDEWMDCGTEIELDDYSIEGAEEFDRDVDYVCDDPLIDVEHVVGSSDNGYEHTFLFHAEFSAEVEIEGTEDSELGYSVSGAKDYMLTDVDDILVGAPGGQGSGQAFLFSGDDGWEIGDDLILKVDENDHMWSGIGENENDQFGLSVHAACDINGDGMPNLMIGAPYFQSEDGKTYIYGLADTPTVLLEFFLNGESEEDKFAEHEFEPEPIEDEEEYQIYSEVVDVSPAKEMNENDVISFRISIPEDEENHASFTLYYGHDDTPSNYFIGEGIGDARVDWVKTYREDGSGWEATDSWSHRYEDEEEQIRIKTRVSSENGNVDEIQGANILIKDEYGNVQIESRRMVFVDEGEGWKEFEYIFDPEDLPFDGRYIAQVIAIDHIGETDAQYGEHVENTVRFRRSIEVGQNG